MQSTKRGGALLGDGIKSPWGYIGEWDQAPRHPLRQPSTLNPRNLMMSAAWSKDLSRFSVALSCNKVETVELMRAPGLMVGVNIAIFL